MRVTQKNSLQNNTMTQQNKRQKTRLASQQSDRTKVFFSVTQKNKT